MFLVFEVTVCCCDRIKCDEVECDAEGSPILLRCSYVPDANIKVKGTIQWVPAQSAVSVEVRMYSYLFTVEEPTDENWEKELNPESEVVIPTALVDPSIVSYYKVFPDSNNVVPATSPTHFQFERLGFFALDKDTTASKLVFNLTVSLKDSKPAAVTSGKFTDIAIFNSNLYDYVY